MSVSRGMWSLKSSTELTRKGMWQDNTWRKRNGDNPGRVRRRHENIHKYIYLKFVFYVCVVHLSEPPARGSGRTKWLQWWSFSSEHCPQLQRHENMRHVHKTSIARIKSVTINITLINQLIHKEDWGCCSVQYLYWLLTVFQLLLMIFTIFFTRLWQNNKKQARDCVRD